MKEVLKKNILSIICGVVAIGAIIASFIPLGSYATELQGKLDKSKADGSAAKSLLDKPRNKPIVSPDASGAEPLGTFPNDKVNEAGQRITGLVEQQSLRMRQVAEEMNIHKALVSGSLPLPSPGVDIAFRQEYTKLYTPGENGELPPIVASTEGHPPLKPATPPLEANVQAALAEAVALIRSENESRFNNAVTNQGEVQQLIAEKSRLLPEEMRQAVAKSSLVYIDPGTFRMNEKIQALPPGARPDPVDIWWSQVQLWVQQDVLNAIADANADKTSVLDAPVKHLFSVAIPATFVSGAAAAPGAAAVDSMNGNPDSPITKVPTVSMTGRVSNALYDVIHFDMVVDVEVAQIPQFLRTLSDNRLVFVREMSISSVDSAGELAKGYYYGENPVAHLTLRCETLLMRKWSTPLMPPGVKQMFGIVDPPPGDPAATPTAMAQ